MRFATSASEGPGVTSAGALRTPAATAGGSLAYPRGMRNPLCFALLVLAFVPVRAAAQPDPSSPYVLSDSTRILPRWLEGQIQLGLGWMGSPRIERGRYQVGIAGAAAAEARPAHALALRARVAYQDLPTRPFETVLIGATPVDISSGLGHGRLVTVLAEASSPLTPWLWAVAGAGGAYYGSNGQPLAYSPQAADFVPLERSRWGSAWSTGVQYRFQPNPRDRFIIEARSEAVAASTHFRFWGLSAGYRFP